MKEITQAVQLETSSLTGDELQRMAVGLLQYAKVLPEGQWPEHAVFFDVAPIPNRSDAYSWTVRMCESEEEEAELEALNALLADAETGESGALHFALKRR